MKGWHASAVRYCAVITSGAVVCTFTPLSTEAETRTLRGRMELAHLPSSLSRPQSPQNVLLGVTVIGATALPPERLATVYADYLTKQVDISDLSQIAERITQVYRDQGYFLSQAVAGPQNLSHGIGTITVIEGRITRVSVHGDRAELVEPFLAGIAEAPVAHLADVDERLTRIRQIPGLSVTSRIRPDPDYPRDHELVLETKFEGGKVFAGLHNWGWEQAGPLQGYATYVLNSFVSPRDQLTLSIFTTPEDPGEYTQLGLGYSYGRMNGDNIRLVVHGSSSGNLSRSRVDSIWGESLSIGGRYERPLALRRRQSLWLIAGVDAEHRQSEWGESGGYSDELRVIRLGLRGARQDDRSSSRYQIEVSKGFGVLGASGRSAARRSRFGADAEFAKLNFGLSHYRAFGRNFGVYADLGGQLADGPLLLSEAYAVGGPDLGRAYRYGEITGDHGLGGQVELRANFAPDIVLISSVQGYTYYDIASVWNDASSDWEAQDLSSAGFGVRVFFLDSLTARLELGKPLTRTPFDESDQDWRRFFQVALSY